jgi:hypothetical protein
MSGFGIFEVPQFPDGVRFEDLQAAIQAAWCVDCAFAAELAKRYDLYNQLCLRCADAHITAVDPSEMTKSILGAFAYQLCQNCNWAEIRIRIELRNGDMERLRR